MVVSNIIASSFQGIAHSSFRVQCNLHKKNSNDDVGHMFGDPSASAIFGKSVEFRVMSLCAGQISQSSECAGLFLEVTSDFGLCGFSIRCPVCVVSKFIG